LFKILTIKKFSVVKISIEGTSTSLSADYKLAIPISRERE